MTIAENENLLDAPNVHLVVNSGPNDLEIVGRARIDATQPHSVENRGYEVIEVHREQGVSSSDEATRMAKTYAAAHPHDYAELSFQSTPDPRHDTFDLIEFGDVVYRERSWTLRLRPGGPHTHDCTRAGYVRDD